MALSFEKIQEKFSSLPAIVQYGLELPVFSTLVDDIVKEYGLTGKEASMDEFIWELFFKELDPSHIGASAIQRFGLMPDKVSGFSKDVIGKLLLVFPEQFPEIEEILKKLGGDPESYYQESELFSALVDILQKELEKEEPPELKVDYDREAAALRNIFTTSILDLLKGDDDLKSNLNDTAIFLMTTREGYATLLANDLLLNQQQLGTSKIIREGKEFTQTVEQWLRDVIATVGIEHMTTITLAKYAAENQNAKKLNTEEKDILRSVLEMYRVLSTYPEGFSKLSREEWMVIPFRKEEKAISSKYSVVSSKQPADSNKNIINKKQVKEDSPKKEIPTQPLTQEKSMIPSLSSLDYSPLVQEAILRATLGEIDDETKRRLENIILTRIKNVRTSVETKEKLTTAKDKGGVGFTDEQAEQVLKSVNIIADQVLKGATTVVAESPQTGQARIPANLAYGTSGASTNQESSEKKEEAPTEKERVEMVKKIDDRKTPVNLPTVQPIVSSKFTAVSSQPLITSKKPSLSIEEVDGLPTLVEKPNFAEASLGKPNVAKAPIGEEVHRIPITVRSVPQQSVKSDMTDVKGPRLIDPIEELRIMSLKDFRRLSPDPMEAVKRIHQKIQMLEKESFTKKQTAIDAWHESEINKLYMEIGKESFGKGLDIQQVITQKQAEGKVTLSAQEFDALVELNEMIRF